MAARERAAAAAEAAAHVRGAKEADALGIPRASGGEGDEQVAEHRAAVQSYVAAFVESKVVWTNSLRTEGRLAQVDRLEAELAIERVKHWKVEHRGLAVELHEFQQRLQRALAATPAEPLPAAATGGAERAGAGAPAGADSAPSGGEGGGAEAAAVDPPSSAPVV